MLELRNITKIISGKKHIKETNLILQKGHFNVLLGKTGSGKTSLIKLMAGLDPVATGSIFMGDRDITKLTTQQRQISLVHQFFVNYPHMTVYDNIASPLRVAGMSQMEIEERVEEAANILKLKPMLYRRPHELSGGQQQRTALARAIAKNSKAVFLDEPLANLDYKLREELRELLPELFADRGAVVVYATSEPEEALLLGGETALMEDGHVRQFGKTAEVYRNPMTLTASQIFSDPPINSAQVEKRGSQIFLQDIFWELPAKFRELTDGTYRIAIRPHHVFPEMQGDYTVPIVGKVGVTEISGSDSSAHFDFAGNGWVSLAQGVHPYTRGNEHTFYINPNECLFFTLDGKRAA